MNYQMLINGNMVDGDQKMDVINPATGKLFAHAPRASAAQLEEAVAAAKAAFPAWSARSWQDRRAVLLQMADAIEGAASDIAAVLTQEQGKPIAQAMQEVHGAAYFFRATAQFDAPGQTLVDEPERKVVEQFLPLGVVAAIVPWNFPLMMVAFKLPPALLAGNTIVVKPAPTTPLSTLMVARLIARIAPPGVVNIIADCNDLGGQLAAHRDVAKVSFTGSTATGRKVYAGSADTIKRMTLELGGNDAAIVLDDVDVAQIAPAIFAAAFANSGQVCIAIKRLFVHDAIYDELCDALARIAEAAVVGNGLEEGTEFGPLQNRAQYDKVRAMIEEARGAGVIIAGGDSNDGPGYFIRPTIVRDVAEGVRIVDEEQFGPVLPIIRFADEDDAVRRANASDFGLGASVWSADPARAEALAERLVAGTVWVNKHLDVTPHIPFGGARQSGLGAEMGIDGLTEFMQRRIVSR
ncbi:aldehyde dehydrogenase family protein [Croceicoccus sp. F390]|uniref:Aldehyde dehydrogenase family protein n=1 Tax=Croceicoccus esteveae TaxID=3075597 RepID=A0ABU2ZHD8_9SPHN|nr:aldehyde dehydrogenase family protein [Croceicoccus sp. F390]MDT0576022.1 aldehyde dehydrogenase family protein [Croceicoccus sp. F390]